MLLIILYNLRLQKTVHEKMIERKKFYKNRYLKIIVCTLAIGYVFFPGSKNKANLRRVNGISLKNSNKSYEGKDSFNYRFLEITNYKKPFEIFLGKESGDFKPDFQNVDVIKVGDSISIYYDESLHTRSSFVNNLTYFIDRNEEAIYVKGKSAAIKVYGLLIFTILMSAIIIYLSMRFNKKVKPQT